MVDVKLHLGIALDLSQPDPVTARQVCPNTISCRYLAEKRQSYQHPRREARLVLQMAIREEKRLSRTRKSNAIIPQSRSLLDHLPGA